MKAVAIVLDSVGLGYLPDAPLFGDEGADTLDHPVLKTGSGPGAGSAACGR